MAPPVITKKAPTLTIILWEANAEMHLLDFFLKEVLLVEKEDNGRGCEELVVADAVEQVQGLVHAVLGRGNAAETPGWA